MIDDSGGFNLDLGEAESLRTSAVLGYNVGLRVSV